MDPDLDKMLLLTKLATLLHEASTSGGTASRHVLFIQPLDTMAVPIETRLEGEDKLTHAMLMIAVWRFRSFSSLNWYIVPFFPGLKS